MSCLKKNEREKVLKVTLWDFLFVSKSFLKSRTRLRFLLIRIQTSFREIMLKACCSKNVVLSHALVILWIKIFYDGIILVLCKRATFYTGEIFMVGRKKKRFWNIMWSAFSILLKAWFIYGILYFMTRRKHVLVLSVN